ncbi:hypothetical protein E5D57_007679 [Metarhizium anisopliae]|nr:hypothetical protein E5D57_007679 [Metarhizium anisopliae]
MSAENYVNGPGAGEKLGHKFWYSQAIIVGNTVKCSGQGGWDADGNVPADNAAQQVDNTFANIDRLLQSAGLRGWEDVLSVRSYHVSMSKTLDLYIARLRQRIPCHRPVSTVLGVPELADARMLIELEVEAKKQ